MAGPLPRRTLEALRTFDSATISSVMEPLGVRSPLEGFAGPLICMYPHLGVTVGYAVTTTFDTTTPRPAGEVAVGYRSLMEAVDAAPKPVVVVAQDVGPRPGRAGTVGDFSVTLQRRMGAVAWITNGVFRDFEDVGTLGYQVYAKGTTVSHGQGQFTSIGEPVEIEGLTVHNGDLIHADVDGVQTVPIEVVDEVLAAAEKDRQFELEARAFMNSDDYTLDEALKRMGH